MAEIDFTQGSWGHKLHGHTFAAAKAPSIISWLKDKIAGAYRGSAMCHSNRCPQVGDFVSWKSKNSIVRAPIYKVEHCHNPSDMHKIYMRVTDDCRTSI